jgi:thymidine kinase
VVPPDETGVEAIYNFEYDVVAVDEIQFLSLAEVLDALASHRVGSPQV